MLLRDHLDIIKFNSDMMTVTQIQTTIILIEFEQYMRPTLVTKDLMFDITTK